MLLIGYMHIPSFFILISCVMSYTSLMISFVMYALGKINSVLFTGKKMFTKTLICVSIIPICLFLKKFVEFFIHLSPLVFIIQSVYFIE